MTKEERVRTLELRRRNPTRGMQQCYWDAKGTIHFRKTLAADVKSYKRRSAAAKKAWRVRKAKQW